MIVYLITNTHNGKKYVGKTTKTIDARWLEHVYFALEYDSENHFHRAIRKHGVDAFKREILAECSVDKLDQAEKSWIKKLDTTNPNTGYNMTFGGDGGKITPEAARKISVALKGRKQSPEAIANRTKNFKGFKHSQETRARMKDARNKRTDRHTNDFRKKMAERQRELWADPEHRTKMIEAQRRAWERRKKVAW